VASFNTRTGPVTLSSLDVTNALTFTPYNATNPAGYQTAAQVTAAVPLASSTNPLMDGTVAIGTGTTWARADHVHASDTSRAPTASPTFTGTLAISGADPLMRLTAAAGVFARISYTVGAQAWSAGGWSDGNFAISNDTAAAERLFITPAGVVNIPITLSIGGNGVQYRFGQSNIIGFGWAVGSTLHAFVDATDLGAIQITASSRRYKTAIVPATKDALGCLQQVELCAFDRLGLMARHEEIGFIAEQIEPLIPEAVLLDEDGAADALDLMPLLAYAVRGIQQLAAQNAALEARIAALEGARH
jgi:hypothetical protein